MPIDAITIQIFLPDGDPRGVRIAVITTRIVQAVQVPRLRLEVAVARPELKHVGVYFLFDESDERAKTSQGQTLHELEHAESEV